MACSLTTLLLMCNFRYWFIYAVADVIFMHISSNRFVHFEYGIFGFLDMFFVVVVVVVCMTCIIFTNRLYSCRWALSVLLGREFVTRNLYFRLKIMKREKETKKNTMKVKRHAVSVFFKQRTNRFCGFTHTQNELTRQDWCFISLKLFEFGRK